MKKWIFDMATKYCGENLQQVRDDTADKLGIVFFFVAIATSLFVFLLPKILPILKSKLKFSNETLHKFTITVVVLISLLFLVGVYFVEMPCSGICAVLYLLIVSAIPIAKLLRAINDDDLLSSKLYIGQIRAFYTMILIILLTYQIVLNMLDFSKIPH